ncbi:glycosyltransferase family A protein, partial [Nostoc sp. NIES-2111]
MKLCVIIATHGRTAILEQLLIHLRGQTRRADGIVLSVPRDPGDGLRCMMGPHDGLDVATAEVGLCAQRNAGIEAARGRFDVLVFLDDDFVPHDTFLATVE